MNTKINPDFSAHLNNFYNHNPYVKLLGIHIDDIKPGEVTLSLDTEAKHSNFYRIAHGGALASLADTAMGATCLSANKKVVTQSMNMYYIKAVPEETHLVATGHILHNGRKTLVCEVEIKDAEGTVCCKASANFFVIGTYLEPAAEN